MGNLTNPLVLLLLCTFAIAKFDFKCVERHIREETLEQLREDPAKFNNFLVGVVAAKCNSLELEALLEDPRVDPTASKNFAISWAGKVGNPKNVNALLKWKGTNVEKVDSTLALRNTNSLFIHDSLLGSGDFTKVRELVCDNDAFSTAIPNVRSDIDTFLSSHNVESNLKQLQSYLKVIKDSSPHADLYLALKDYESKEPLNEQETSFIIDLDQKYDSKLQKFVEDKIRSEEKAAYVLRKLLASAKMDPQITKAIQQHMKTKNPVEALKGFVSDVKINPISEVELSQAVAARLSKMPPVSQQFKQVVSPDDGDCQFSSIARNLPHLFDNAVQVRQDVIKSKGVIDENSDDFTSVFSFIVEDERQILTEDKPKIKTIADFFGYTEGKTWGNQLSLEIIGKKHNVEFRTLNQGDPASITKTGSTSPNRKVVFLEFVNLHGDTNHYNAIQDLKGRGVFSLQEADGFSKTFPVNKEADFK